MIPGNLYHVGVNSYNMTQKPLFIEHGVPRDVDREAPKGAVYIPRSPIPTAIPPSYRYVIYS